MIKKIYATTTIFAVVLSFAAGRTPVAAGAPRQQETRFSSRNEFFEARKNTVIERLGLQPLDKRQEVDRQIQEEMDALDKVAGFRSIVTKGEGAGISSHPEAGIIVSIAELERIHRQSGVRKSQQVLRFLLAHEKSHQIQYLEYSAKAVHLSEREQRRVYECQADMLAGKYLIESFGEPTPEDRLAIEDALQVAFDLGTEEYAGSAAHPSHEQRRVAVRLGMASGMIFLLSKRLPDPPAKAMIDSLAGKINIRLGESLLGWSYRVAKKITHYSPDATADIKVEDEEVEWDERASNPFVRFRLVYKNTGTRTVKVDMEVQCLSVLRTDKANSKYWQKWGNRNYIFRLRPGESYVVQGRLPWYADADLRPRLIYPLHDSALMSCEYVR